MRSGLRRFPICPNDMSLDYATAIIRIRKKSVSLTFNVKPSANAFLFSCPRTRYTPCSATFSKYRPTRCLWPSSDYIYNVHRFLER